MVCFGIGINKMNEEVYYTIKKLIYKVMEDTDSFEVIGKGDCVFEYKRIGVKDNRNSFEILEDDFNRLWFINLFLTLYTKRFWRMKPLNI